MIDKKDAEYIFYNLAYRLKTYDDLAKEYLVNKATLCKWMRNFKSEFGLSDTEKYCAYTYLRYKYKDDIINQYHDGKSTTAIANFYGFSYDHMIAELLKECNVEIRPVGYSSRTNQSLFQDINSELSAYVLGLITSDGSIGTNYSINIHLTESDRYLLEEINSRLYNNSGHILTEKKDTGKNVCRLSINGKQICENLKKYNVIPNKSYLLTNMASLPEELMPHYIRGLFDGDGVCAYNNPYLRIGYCAYRIEFVQSYQNFLVEHLNLNKNQLFNTGSCWQCSWGSRKDIEAFYHYIYDNATIFLSRKKDKIYSYLYGNTEVTI